MLPVSVSAEIIDLLRSKNTAIRAGAKSFPMSEASVRICRLTEDPSASWVAENNSIPEDSSMSIGAVNLVAKKLTCLVKASKELLADAGNAGTVIMNAIAAAMAGELDFAVYFGNGGNSPTGIWNDADVNSYELGTGNGAQLSGYDDLLYGTKAIIGANGPMPSAAVMSPRTLVDYSLQKDTTDRPLPRPDLLKNVQFFDSSRVPNDFVVGTSSDTSSILLGTFQHLVIGLRQAIEVQVLRERYADVGQTAFLATLRADVATFQPKAFCIISGIKPS